MEKLIEIKDDLFGIAERVKSIDANYKIYFNGDTHGYELHNTRCYPSYQLTYPFPRLDKRAVDYTLKSDVKNKERILKEIERHNEQLEKEHTHNTIESIMSKLEI